MRLELEYRIQNLKFAIEDYEQEDQADLSPWSLGYREGRLQAMESELRFLQGLIKNIA